MDINENNLSLNKYLKSLGIIANKEYQKFFNEIDAQIIAQKFVNVDNLSKEEKSQLENAQNMSAYDINKIIDHFMNLMQEHRPINKININELIKLFNLPSDKLRKSINPAKYKVLIAYLQNVSHETLLISYDFMLLKLIDNIIAKDLLSTNANDDLILFKKILFDKIMNFNYKKEQKEKEQTYYCWFDRLLTAVTNKEISPVELKTIYLRIFSCVYMTDSLYWKAINTINYILQEDEFKNNDDLYILKIKLKDHIKYKNVPELAEVSNIKNIMISLYSKEKFTYEELSHLFIDLKSIATISEDQKKYCLKLFRYILYYDKRANYFKSQFIRLSLLDNVENILQTSDSTIIKQKELQLLLDILHMDVFYINHKKSILNTVLRVLKSINNGVTKITHGNFYKYCDFIDLIIYSTPDIGPLNVVDYLSNSKEDKKKIGKHFKLTKNSDFSVY